MYLIATVSLNNTKLPFNVWSHVIPFCTQPNCLTILILILNHNIDPILRLFPVPPIPREQLINS